MSLLFFNDVFGTYAIQILQIVQDISTHCIYVYINIFIYIYISIAAHCIFSNRST